MLFNTMKRMQGTSLTETLIILPVFLMLTLGAIQYSLIYEAKSALNYATFMSARAGAVDHARKNAITYGLAKSIAPLYSPDKNAGSLIAAIGKARLDVAAFSQIKILNPTREAFKDFGVKNKKKNLKEIPNEMLHLASTKPGKLSKLNIQDANLLKVQVVYGYKLKVPFVNKVITTVSSWFTRDAIKLGYLSQNRLPILATATVRMQSRAWENSWVTKTADVNKAVGDSEKPAQPLILAKIKRPWTSGPTGQGDPSARPPIGNIGNNPGNNTGNNPGNNTGSNPGNNTGSNPGSNTGSNPGNNAGNNPADDTVKCETKWSDDRYKKSGSWLNPFNWKDNIKAAASIIWDFFKGLATGLGDQLKGIWELFKDPLVLGKVAKAFITDPKGTLNALLESVGADVKKVAQCGPRDIGRVIGNYIGPGGSSKILTALAKITKSKKLLAYAKRKKCGKKASFTANTPIWTPDGNISIEKLLKGRLVKSRDENTLENSDQRITALLGRIAEGYHRIQTEAGVIEATAEHPFWVQGKGWVKAKDLEWKYPIATVNGDVVIYQNEYIKKSTRVYNFTVDSTHNYFAGSMGAWVHNAKKGGKGANCEAPILASKIPIIKPGTKEWNAAVSSLSGLGKGKMNFRTGSATDAKRLLQEARGKMDRQKNYTNNTYKKGYEVHNKKNKRELEVGNDLQHLKWKDGKSGGHIYYDNPN